MRFFVERIDVRNLRHAGRDVIVSEARLHEGAAYSEAELREASDRIERLPFVLDAQFSLEKGSRRDAYVLVMTVEETKPFFYGIDFTLYRAPDEHLVVAPVDDRLSSVGYRFFTGRRGMVHLAVAEHEYLSSHAERTGAIGVGYTQYSLFGSDAFASVNLSLPLGTASSRQLLPEVVVGLPLTSTQTLTVSAVSSLVDSNYSRNVYRRRAIQAEWSHNTTNHPFFPTRGTLLSAGPLFAEDDDTYHVFSYVAGEPPRQTEVRERTHTVGLGLAAAHYWELSDRNSVALRGEADLRHTAGRRNGLRISDNYTPTSAIVSFSHSLLDPRQVRDADSRLEASLRLGNGRKDYFFFREHSAIASLDWVFRNAWGAVRLGVGYAW